MYSGGAPLAGEGVVFTIEGLYGGTGTSDATGTAAASFTIPPTMASGVHNVQAHSYGDAAHAPAQRTTPALTVATDGAGVSSSPYAASGLTTETVTLESLMYTGGAPLAGRVVRFFVDGVPVGTGVSNSTAVQIPYTIPAATAAGLHNVMVTFAGDATYRPASRTTAALRVFVSGLPSGLAPSPGPAFCHDARHTGRGVGAGAIGALAWSFRTGGDVVSTPAIGPDGTVCVGSSNHKLYAVNPADGSVKWSFIASALVLSSPSIGADGTIYFDSYDGNLYAVNPADGSQKWAVAISSPSWSSPAIGVDGTLYAGSYEGNLYAIR